MTTLAKPQKIAKWQEQPGMVLLILLRRYGAAKLIELLADEVMEASEDGTNEREWTALAFSLSELADDAAGLEAAPRVRSEKGGPPAVTGTVQNPFVTPKR